MDARNITLRPLPYQRLLPTRPLSRIDLLVIHCTELPDLATAREYGERRLYSVNAPGNVSGKNSGKNSGMSRGTGNSGHFYIDRDGSIEQWVDPQHIAHHVRGYNPRSVGIELVNRGRFPDWFHSDRQQMTESYPERQMDALLQLIRWLREDLPALRQICGHAELDQEHITAADNPAVQISRKLDPGPLFPWPHVMAACGLQRFAP
ncbi:MAG: N-acetylmuramoyl-L-alanine amidase [Xanthomonadales bacterium]|nr:N-acetylmuramoyl-L-alanine amidase [Xanthomonadales bacterium]